MSDEKKPTLIIDIEIPQESEVDENKKKPPIKSIAPYNPLHRRVLPGTLVNFYDLVQRVDDNGNVTEIPFSLAKTISLNGSGFPDNLEEFTLNDWNILRDQVFSIPLEQWKDKYKKLEFEEAWKYGIDISVNEGIFYPVASNGERLTMLSEEEITESKWTDKGLKLDNPGSENYLKINTAGAFAAFPNIGWKITREPSYSADEVEDFKLQSKANIFLMPHIIVQWGESSSGNLYSYVNFLYTYMSRKYWIDHPFVEQIFTKDFLNVNISNDKDKFEHLANHIKSLQNSRYFVNNDGAYGYEDPYLFPKLFEYYASFTANESGVGNLHPQVNIPEGAFILAVNQNKEWFYFWNAAGGGNNSQYTFQMSRLPDDGGGGPGNPPSGPITTITFIQWDEEESIQVVGGDDWTVYRFHKTKYVWLRVRPNDGVAYRQTQYSVDGDWDHAWFDQTVPNFGGYGDFISVPRKDQSTINEINHDIAPTEFVRIRHMKNGVWGPWATYTISWPATYSVPPYPYY